MKFLTVREMMGLMLTGFVLAAVYGSLLLGPLPSVVSRMASPDDDRLRAKAAEAIISGVPDNAPVLASYALLPHLSSREELYSLHYAFLGVTQFATAPYEIPEEIRFMALDTRDLITYQAQFPNTAWAAPYFDGGHERLASVAGAETFNLDSFRLFDRESKDKERHPIDTRTVDALFGGVLRLDSAASEITDYPTTDGSILSVYLNWSAVSDTGENPIMTLVARDSEDKIIVERSYPFGNGFVPAHSLTDRGLMNTINIPLPEDSGDIATIELNLKTQDAKLVLSGIRSHELYIQDTKDWGTTMLPGPISAQ